jgi:hypothetical protein
MHGVLLILLSVIIIGIIALGTTLESQGATALQALHIDIYCRLCNPNV